VSQTQTQTQTQTKPQAGSGTSDAARGVAASVVEFTLDAAGTAAPQATVHGERYAGIACR
jgi:hypothetical protein